MATRLNAIFQVGIVCGFWLICEQAAQLAKLPVSGGILGLVIVLLLLTTKRIKLASVKRGTQLLLGDMLLFFILSVLGILKHQEFISLLGIKILFVIVFSTILVMLVTAVVVDYCYRWSINHA